MSSKYDKSISMSHEEEGMYHRREIEHIPAKPQTVKTTKTYHQVVPKRSEHAIATMRRADSSDDNDDFEEWTVSKRKVNHKTRQVETRVSRQLLVEDGKVIADSGPQVVTRIKEDNKEEECEKEKEPKNKGKFEALENAPECDSSGRVLGEKRQITRVTHEVREENMHYHDERFKELSGQDVHRKAIKAPHELITIKSDDSKAPPRGKMVHYSNKGRKYRDTDEVLEVAKLAIDGSVTKEVKRTKHHEEFSEDEKPDETGEAEVLRETGPKVERSSRRHVDYVNDFDDDKSPISSGTSDDDQRRHSSGAKHHGSSRAYKTSSANRRHNEARGEDPAFPRYEIDPLLNSLREEDFKVPKGAGYDSPLSQRRSRSRPIEHPVGRKDRSDSASSSDIEASHHRRQQQNNKHRMHSSPVAERSVSRGSHHSGAVEIPPEYRINKHGSKRTGSRSSLLERSHSPSHSSHVEHHRTRPMQHGGKSSSSRAVHHRSSRKEDASVQAHLTDEEEERKSMKSTSSSDITHEKQTRHLQRQSTANSSRRYYYGDGETPVRARNEDKSASVASRRRRPSSVSSSASSSASSVKENRRQRKHGDTKGRDSGFKSPTTYSDRMSTPASMKSEGDKQIYSVSNKTKGGLRRDVVSPTPTQTSLGQRSVKTTTTSLTAGLADRPTRPERQDRSISGSTKKRDQSDKYIELDSDNIEQVTKRKQARKSTQSPSLDDESGTRNRHAFDNVSLSSLGHATTIKVPYRRIEIQRSNSDDDNNQSDWSDGTIVKEPTQGNKSEVDTRSSKDLASKKSAKNTQVKSQDSVEETSSIMTLQEDIASLGKRLESINKRTNSQDPKRYYDHKTVIANIEPIPIVPKKQIVSAYNVRVIEHKSPFQNEQQPITKISDLTDSIARLELLSQQSDSGRGSSTMSAGDNNSAKISVINGTSSSNQNNNVDNNNEINFNLSQFIKYKATPVMVEPSIALDGRIHSTDEDDEEKMSVTSSCSLKSSRTYVKQTTDSVNKIDKIGNPNDSHDQACNDQENRLLDELDVDGKRPKAWLFDPNSGTSIAIAPPVRPKQPEPPKIDSRTEELVQARGGRSYYIELVEPEESPAKRSCSIDPLYQRWSSQSALNIPQHNSAATATTTTTNPSRMVRSKSRFLDGQDEDARHNNLHSRPIITNTYSTRNLSTLSSNKQANNNDQDRHRTPALNRLPLSSRSKSSSCLVGSTRSSKYSIYGGLRKPNESGKPVPRLSYSRAIGPKLHRHVEAQTKPSRYLKMK